MTSINIANPGASENALKAALGDLTGSVLLTSGSISTPVDSVSFVLPDAGYSAFMLNFFGIQFTDYASVSLRVQASIDDGVNWLGDDNFKYYYNSHDSQFRTAARLIAGITCDPNEVVSMSFMITTGGSEADAALAGSVVKSQTDPEHAISIGINKLQESSVTLVSGGVGYTVGDQLTVSDYGSNFGGVNTVVEVDTVDGDGAILTFHVATQGYYATVAWWPNPAGVTGGSGSGATFNEFFESVVAFPITAIKVFLIDGNAFKSGKYRLFGII